MSALFFARLISGRFKIIREPLVSRAPRYMAVVALTLCVPSIHLAALSSKSAFSFPYLMPVILWPSLDPTTLSGWGYGTGKPASQHGTTALHIALRWFTWIFPASLRISPFTYFPLPTTIPPLALVPCYTFRGQVHDWWATATARHRNKSRLVAVPLCAKV